jgi:hypothetical protein
MKLLFNSTIAFLICLFCQYGYAQPKELGTINWLRDYDTASIASKKHKKDILILFQEVPGCSTCQKYGDEVMSNSFINEVIETYYIPLAIYNNKGGKDKIVLDRYKEPSWNNPVLRIVNNEGNPTQNRLAGKYSKSEVLDYLKNDLNKKTKLPEYINIVGDEWYAENQKEEITMSMYCFWTGEKTYGELNGVVNTTAGFMDGKEVVKVEFNPSLTSAKHIINHGKKNKCADGVYVSDKSLQKELNKNKIGYNTYKKFRPDKDQNYYLKKSKYSNIPMSKMQAMKVNSALGKGQNPEYLLSPRQLEGVY